MKKQKKKTRSIAKKTAGLKKELKAFLLQEEGKISKKNIAKMGLSLAMLNAMIHPDHALASHTNVFNPTGTGCHTSHAAHGSHGSHGSHSSIVY